MRTFIYTFHEKLFKFQNVVKHTILHLQNIQQKLQILRLSINFCMIKTFSFFFLFFVKTFLFQDSLQVTLEGKELVSSIFANRAVSFLTVDFYLTILKMVRAFDRKIPKGPILSRTTRMIVRAAFRKYYVTVGNARLVSSQQAKYVYVERNQGYGGGTRETYFCVAGYRVSPLSALCTRNT